MEQASRINPSESTIAPSATMTTDAVNLEAVIKSAMKQHLRPKKVFKALSTVTFATAFVTLIAETERQRREILTVKKDQKAMLAYLSVLIDETDTGKEAFTRLAEIAEAEEEEEVSVSDVSDLVDEAPIQKTLTKDAMRAIELHESSQS